MIGFIVAGETDVTGDRALPGDVLVAVGRFLDKLSVALEFAVPDPKGPGTTKKHGAWWASVSPAGIPYRLETVIESAAGLDFSSFTDVVGQPAAAELRRQIEILLSCFRDGDETHGVVLRFTDAEDFLDFFSSVVACIGGDVNDVTAAMAPCWGRQFQDLEQELGDRVDDAFRERRRAWVEAMGARV